MKQKFLKDLGIDKQFDLNGFMDQISDNRLKEENKKFDELVHNEQNDKERANKQKNQK